MKENFINFLIEVLISTSSINIELIKLFFIKFHKILNFFGYFYFGVNEVNIYL